jgi:DNA replication protein DnaC
MSVTTPPSPPLPEELERLLRRLRLPYVRHAAPEVIATATSQRWEPADILRVLLTEEAAGRDQATIATRRKSSGLPTGKTFDVWEQDASAIPKATQQALRTLEWIERAETLCICGPSGTGKSHFIEALGHSAIDHGKTVAFHTLETLAALIGRHRPDQSVSKAIGRLIRADLIVVDDIGLLPVSAEAAEALFRVVDAAYEKRSIAISSNIHPAGFDELMPKTLAAATVDRLLHHAHVIITDGSESYRLAQATTGQGSDAPGQLNAPRALDCATAYGLRCVEHPRNPTRHGENSWPPVGRKDGRRWGKPMSVYGEKPMAIDTPGTRRDRLHPGRSIDRQSLQRHRDSQRPRSVDHQPHTTRAHVDETPAHKTSA